LLWKDYHMSNLINRFCRDDRGAAMVEYALLVALIAVVCVAAVTTLGQDVSSAFSVIASDVAKAV
jgi:pilus assembly protein Flp/PilA